MNMVIRIMVQYDSLTVFGRCSEATTASLVEVKLSAILLARVKLTAAVEVELVAASLVATFKLSARVGLAAVVKVKSAATLSARFVVGIEER